MPPISVFYEIINFVYLHLNNPSFLVQVKTRTSKELTGGSVTSFESFLELMGGVPKTSDPFSLLASIIALGGAVFLIIKTLLSNLEERSSEIGILKAAGWTEKDVQKQLMGRSWPNRSWALLWKLQRDISCLTFRMKPAEILRKMQTGVRGGPKAGPE